MGYSISQEQSDRLERNRNEGRLCAFSTGRGGCFNRAVVKETYEDWYYEHEKDAGLPPRKVETVVFCKCHAHETGYEGANFRVLSAETF